MPNSAPRAWQVVLERIEGDLREGRLAPGDRLTPERELATQLGVVRTATGSGPTAGAMIVTTPRGGLAAFLRLQVAANGFPLGDVVRTRIVLECDVAERLAGAEADLTDTLEVLDAMDAEDLASDEFLALDARFHQALAEASGNAVVSAMMAGLRSSIEAYTRAGALRLDDWASTARRLRREHRRIVDAVERGDAAEARECIRRHIADYYTEVAQALSPTDTADEAVADAARVAVSVDGPPAPG